MRRSAAPDPRGAGGRLRRAGARGLAFLLGAAPAALSACPTCKDALSGNPEAEGFANGIFLSIVVMLGVLFSAVGFLIYKLVRMARDEAKVAPASPGTSGGKA